MSDFPIITTARLLFSKPDNKIISELVSLAQDPEISQNTLNFPFPYSIDHAKKWIEMADKNFENKESFVFALIIQETGEFIGGIGIHPSASKTKAEIGYWIGKKFRNKGYATEAVERILKFGFEDLELEMIYATHFTYNPISGNILKKVGMAHKGILKEHYQKNGKFEDVILYEKQRNEHIS